MAEGGSGSGGRPPDTGGTVEDSGLCSPGGGPGSSGRVPADGASIACGSGAKVLGCSPVGGPGGYDRSLGGSGKRAGGSGSRAGGSGKRAGGSGSGGRSATGASGSGRV
ncbi:hypothetical protein GCM10027088_55580 [Nocardia goodfellowii]